MLPAMVNQSRWGVRTRFEFGASSLHYRVQDWSGSREFEAPYEGLVFDQTSVMTHKEQRLLRFGYFAVAASFLVLETMQSGSDAYTGYVILFMAVAGAVLLIWQLTEVFDVSVTFIPTEIPHGYSVVVIHDRKHDQIVESLKTQKHQRVRTLLNNLDLNGDLARERAKFDWLLAGGFIEAGEHADALTKINAALTPYPFTGGRLN